MVSDETSAMMEDHERWMRVALDEAMRAAEEGEVPVGAVVVRDGRIIGRGHNRTEATHDPTAHAEVLAIGAAGETLQDWRLTDADLYVTLEPCAMCAGAIQLGRLRRVIFGPRDPKFGACGSVRAASHPHWEWWHLRSRSSGR